MHKKLYNKVDLNKRTIMTLHSIDKKNGITVILDNKSLTIWSDFGDTLYTESTEETEEQAFELMQQQLNELY